MNVSVDHIIMHGKDVEKIKLPNAGHIFTKHLAEGPSSRVLFRSVSPVKLQMRETADSA